MHVIEALWPSYGDPSRPPSADDEATKQDVAKLLKGSWSPDTSDLALELARSIDHAEEERRKTAESKATNCLLLIAALIAFLTYLEGLLSSERGPSASQLISVPMLILTVVYLLASALWGLRAISVANYAAISVADVMRIGASGRDMRAVLARETLVKTRLNQELVNWKITAYRNCYEFLYRAIFLMSCLVAVQASIVLYRAAL